MNGTDRVATDLHGPFDSRNEVIDWMTQHSIAYRPNGEAFQKAVLYAGEMTADESANPWGTAIHRVGA